MSIDALNRMCSGFRTRLKGLLLVAGVGRVLAGALILLPALIVLDWLFVLGTPWRVISLIVFVVAVVAIIRWTLAIPLKGVWTNEQVLSHLDSAVPESEGMLLDLYELEHESEVQELESPVGRQLAEAAVQELAPLARAVQVSGGLHTQKALVWAGLALLVVAACIVAAVPLSQHADGDYVTAGLVRFFNPFTSLRWPHRTTIELAVAPKVAQMEPLELKARVTDKDEVPREVFLSYRVDSADRWTTERLAVERIETTDADGTPQVVGEVAYTFPEVREGLRLFMTGGDYRTDEHRVEISERPYLQKIVAEYRYPTFAQIPNRTLESGQLVGLEGTEVDLTFTSSMTLNKAVFILTLGEEDPVAEELPLSKDGKVFTKSLLLTANGRYEIQLHEESGFREVKPERYEICVTPDEPPEVELLSPGRDLIQTKNAEVHVKFEARDDFGLQTVQLIYRFERGELAPLSPRITGPIPADGVTNSKADFRWDMRRMEDLPDKGTVTYFVRVKDVNPAPGRQPVDSARYKIKLVRPSEFHLEVFERAKRLLTETRIAKKNQLKAWQRGQTWLTKGTGDENDPIWTEMLDKQEIALRAGRAMQMHLDTLVEQYKRNRMEREFMSVRVEDVARLIGAVAEQHNTVASGVRQTKPGSAAEAAAERLKAVRKDGLERFQDNQKMAVLILDRIQRKLYDWRDLQTSAITARLLHERQQEVITITTAIAHKYIGKDMLDLKDKEQEELLTLAKQQRAIFETETELERQLAYAIGKAEKVRRMAILEPLKSAFALLRQYRVNDHLKHAANLIQDNQPDQVTDDQKEALRALDLVMGGLVMAGQKVDTLPDLTLDMPIPMEDPDDVKVVIKDDDKKDPKKAIKPRKIDPETFIKNLPRTVDPLTASVGMVIELQDNVWGRTRFLGENIDIEIGKDGKTKTPRKDMPRFHALTRGVLAERQDVALKGAKLAAEQARKARAPVVLELLGGIGGEFAQSRQLIGVEDYAEGTRRLQRDSIDLLTDIREQFLRVKKAVSIAVTENKRGGGKDFAKRHFILRGKSLDAAARIVGYLDHARILQRHVHRMVKRFAELRPTDAKSLRAKLETGNRGGAATTQGKVAQLVKTVATQLPTVQEQDLVEVKDKDGKVVKKRTWKVRAKLEDAGVAPVTRLDLGKVAAEIKAAKKDQELIGRLEATAGTMASAVVGMRGLLGALVPEDRTAAKARMTKLTTRKVTQAEFEALTSPTAIMARLKKDDRLAPEIRKRMVEELEGLQDAFTGGYKDLLAAYYASFAQKEEAEEAGKE